ncbi:glycosyltransferase family 1 protein, partial [bacterium]|nr:glycosyltransferase family 1 protein [bacterium]
MRILFVSPTLGDAYGQEQILRTTNSLLRSQGHQTFFLADFLVGPLPPCDAFFTLPTLCKINLLTSPWKVFRIKTKLKKILGEIQPDVIHFVDQFDPRIMRFFSHLYPCILTAHTVAPTCPSSQRFFPRQGGVCSSKSGWSCLKHHREHGCLGHFKTPLRRIHALIEFQFKKRALKLFPVIGAISPYIETCLKADGFSSKQVLPVYNPVVKQDPSLQTWNNSPENLLVVASRLVPLKGVGSLIRCLNQLRELSWTCWIFGDGPERESLQQLTAELNLADRVCFKGKTGSFELQRTLQQATALVQPNRGPEGFGMSVAEASASGVPVIGYDVPAINDLVTTGENGLLAPLFPEASLAEKLRELLEDPNLAKKLGEAGPRRMEEKYSTAQHLQQTLKAYQRSQEDFENLRRNPN